MKIEFPGYTNRTDTLTNFPVLVALSNNVDGSGFSFEDTPFLSDEGWDLRFRDTDDVTELNYEIESWDTNAASYVWVQVPELPADGSGYIWAYWGEDDTQQACTTNGATWSEGYAAVWHKDDAPDDAIADSSVSGRHGSKQGSPYPTETAGRVGRAQTYPGDSYIEFPSDFGLFDGSEAFSVSHWIKASDLPTSGDWEYADTTISFRGERNLMFTFADGTTDHERLGFRGEFGSWDTPVESDQLQKNTWYHITVSYNDSGFVLYQDGMQKDSDAGSVSVDSASEENTIGGMPSSGTDRYFNGDMDEVRISSVARSADWVWADYMTVASNTVFSAYGTAEPLDADSPFIATAAASGLATNGAALNGTLISTGSSVTAVSVFWEEGSEDQGTNTTDWANEESFGDYTPALGNLSLDYATNITGLAAGETYTYRYYATNDAGEAWGAAESFTTYETPGTPTIHALSETGLVHVVISGTVNGGTPDPSAHFCLKAGADGGTDDTSDWDIVESAGVQSGAFTNTITGLQDDTTYYARVYVTNEAGEAWSSDIQFSTEELPEQLTLEADQVIDGSAPYIEFTEAPDNPLYASGASPDWLYNFAYYGGVPTVDLAGYKLYCTRASGGTQGSIVLDLNDANLTGTNDMAIQTYRLTGDGGDASDDLEIINVGNIDIGGIDGRISRDVGGPADLPVGDVSIGTETDPAGTTRIGYIWAHADPVSGTPRTRGGDVTIHGTGAVRFEDINGDAGDIVVHGWTSDGNRGGDIFIEHTGDFSVRNMETWHRIGGGGGTAHRSGLITLNGGDASGDAHVYGFIQTQHSGADRNGLQCVVEFMNYHDVTIEGDIIGRYYGSNSIRGTDVFVEDGITGTITLMGDIDLRNGDGVSYGYLRLDTDEQVVLHKLDLDKVGYAYLSSGTGESEITGAISDFDTTESASSGAGTENDPKIPENETRLRAPEGQVVYYSYTPGTLNTDLGGHVWQLRNLDDSGDGGLLMVEPPSGTIIMVR